jgi:hypothetical protein
MQVKNSGSDKDLVGDVVCEILPIAVVGSLFAWVASKAWTLCIASEMVLVKGFFGIVFLGFALGTLAISYILLIALVEFCKDAVGK